MNPFIGQSQAQLESWLTEAQESLATGKTLTQWLAADSQASYIAQMDPLQRIGFLLPALNILDPVHYPADQTQKVTRTTPQYTQDGAGWVFTTQGT